MTSDKPLPPLEKSERLGQLRPRDTRAARNRSIRYTRFVDIMRWALPVTVLVGLGLLLFWPIWHTNRVSAVVVENVPNLMVENLNLTGVDEKGQPYALTADRALQAANTKNLVDLEKPRGEMTMTGGAWVALHADQGRLDQNTKKLWLGGHVEIFHDKGYRFSTQEMNVDIPQSTAWGEQPVEIQGSFGEIHGQGFRFLEGGHTLVVTGPATARLDLRALGRPDKDNLNTSPSR
ncbi:MAG: LPS export ABC transporter periplasmic protein LptC [Bdellovibrionales bacterium]